MICPKCKSKGTYQEIEDFNPGADEFGHPEWVYYSVWHCNNCPEYVYSWDENFKYEGE